MAYWARWGGGGPLQRLFDILDWAPQRVQKVLNVGHVSEHEVAVTPEEVEEAVLYDRANQIRRGRDGRYLLYGRTDAGRKLVVVLADQGGRIAAPVTAFDANDAERRTYFD